MKAPGRIVILGAGPCGLGAAFRLAEAGYSDFHVFERAVHAGGLASSIRDDAGFVWDFGCHVLYSRSDWFNSVMDGALDDWIDQPRDAQVWIAGRLVPYPLQYNIHRLPPAMRRDCVLGLVQAATSGINEFANFREWILGAFGEGIARHFMIPYNEKIWAHPLETMDVGWIADRVARPDLARVITNLVDEKDDSGWGPNARFRYPAVGGTGVVWQRMAERLSPGRISLGHNVCRIEPRARRIFFSDGREESYDVLVSTMPVDRLVQLAGLNELEESATSLSHSTVDVVGVGLKGELPEALADRKWMYFADDGLPFYRVTVLSNFSPSNAPPGHWSLLAEIAHSPHRPLGVGDIVERVIAGYRRVGFIHEGTPVVSRFHHVASPGYPTPTLGRDAALAQLHPALARLGIFSRGRFGAWRYEIANQDHSFLQGAELVGRLLFDEAESTFSS